MFCQVTLSCLSFERKISHNQTQIIYLSKFYISRSFKDRAKIISDWSLRDLL